MSSYARVWAIESRQRAKKLDFPRKDSHQVKCRSFSLLVCECCGIIWLLAYNEGRKISPFLPSPALFYSLSLSLCQIHTHVLHPSITSCFLMRALFFVIHFCNEDTPQLAFPMESKADHPELISPERFEYPPVSLWWLWKKKIYAANYAVNQICCNSDLCVWNARKDAIFGVLSPQW